MKINFFFLTKSTIPKGTSLRETYIFIFHYFLLRFFGTFSTQNLKIQNIVFEKFDVQKNSTYHGSLLFMCHFCLGVFEAVKIRKSGFPFRQTHKIFMQLYGPPMNVHQFSGTAGECQKLCDQLNLSKDNV